MSKTTDDDVSPSVHLLTCLTAGRCQKCVGRFVDFLKLVLQGLQWIIGDRNGLHAVVNLNNTIVVSVLFVKIFGKRKPATELS